MRPATALFLASLRHSHVIAAKCELLFPDNPDPVVVPVEAGSVTIDRTAQNRRHGQLQIPWSLKAGLDLGIDVRELTLGGYARVHRGLRYADGSSELMLLGTLRVESVSWQTLALSASLELTDRMAQVRDEPFTAPYPAAGKRPAQAAIEIVHAVFGDTIAYQAPYDPAALLGDVTYTGSRGDALSQLEQSYGAETYFDAAGDFVFAAKPSGDSDAVWAIDSGQTGVLIDAGESLDRTGIYNGVLVRGQGDADQPPVYALAVHDDPSSPVRWGGPFGRVALVADQTTVTTETEAAAAARSLLALRLKQTRSLALTSAPNPALEAGDTITVRLPDGRQERHLIDAVTIDLGAGAQQILTRTLFAPAHTGVLLGRHAWRHLNSVAA
jgi:hypothetical protein